MWLFILSETIDFKMKKTYEKMNRNVIRMRKKKKKKTPYRGNPQNLYTVFYQYQSFY